MVDVVYSVAASLDGYVASADGSSDWLAPLASGDDDVGEFVASMDVLLVGSHTYAESEEAMAWFGRGPCSDRPVHVFTSRDLPIAGPNVRLTDSPPERFVADLAERGIAAAGLMSGPTLLASFRSAGLVTGYFLGIVPVVLGGGVRLFDPPGSREDLRLIDVKRWSNGVIQLRYQIV